MLQAKIHQDIPGYSLATAYTQTNISDFTSLYTATRMDAYIVYTNTSE